MKARRDAFTLIELLVVVGIIAILIVILLPSLARARARVQAVRCLSNLHGIGQGLVVYQAQNDGYVVPSYNMAGFDITNMTYSGPNAPPSNVIDGWAAILDRDGVVRSSGGLTNNIFYCPNTVDDAGLNDTPYYDDTSPLGYFDWPATFRGPGGDKPPAGDPSSTLPIANFGDSYGLYQHEIRCSYWLNANNPTGTTAPTTFSSPAPLYYTQSAGFGPYGDGSVLPLVKASVFVRPSALIVATDGVYSGRQSKAQKGAHVADTSAAYRIGYRHIGAAGDTTVTNVVFADGHAEPINTANMPPSASAADNSGAYSFLVSQ
jgi:prepilin-type N-terminal cleavage/methylation domain-containing protein/prepilin-type processing-associated H-X9-DG protein